MKFTSPISNGSKVIAKVKVFVHADADADVDTTKALRTIVPAS